uniref:SFRICE_021125 n=1 Tax=Spodoptera frugiperda TaxID=7108 RepID=A0A2H1VIQ1_SPOFR
MYSPQAYQLVFRVSMGGGDCLPSGDTSARLQATLQVTKEECTESVEDRVSFLPALRLTREHSKMSRVYNGRNAKLEEEMLYSPKIDVQARRADQFVGYNLDQTISLSSWPNPQNAKVRRSPPVVLCTRRTLRASSDKLFDTSRQRKLNSSSSIEGST